MRLATFLVGTEQRVGVIVGKNYAEHAGEFNRSGFDASAQEDRPAHPIVFLGKSLDTHCLADGDVVEMSISGLGSLRDEFREDIG